jgi:hypothetical protein
LKLRSIAENKKLLLPQVKSKLVAIHGNTGLIMIWKEILIEPAPGARQYYILAFHHFDIYGPFFDWVQVGSGAEESSAYVPGKVVLMYNYKEDSLVLVWTAHDDNIVSNSSMYNGLVGIPSSARSISQTPSTSSAFKLLWKMCSKEAAPSTG